MKAWQVALGAVVVVGIGAAVFLSTRSAAAASAGAKAFRVDADCRKVEIVDADAAKAALQAAAMAEFKSRSEKAVDYAYRVVSLVIGCHPSKLTMFSGIPGQGGMSWGSIMDAIGDRSVGDLAALAGGALQGDSGYYPGGTASSPVDALAFWIVPEGTRRALYQAAMLVPIPVDPKKYPSAVVPAGSTKSHMFEWGDGLYVTHYKDGRWQADAYNAIYSEPEFLGTFDPKIVGSVSESDILYLAFIEYEPDVGAQA